MLLSSLTLLFFHFPERALLFAFAVLLSLVLSWQWAWKGVAISIGLVTLAFGYHFSSMDAGEAYWHLGMIVALSLGFIATALAAEEIAERVAEPAQEGMAYDLLNQDLQKQISLQESAKKQLETELQTAREAYSQLQNQKIGLEQLLAAARQEAISLSQEKEAAERELINKTHSAARNQEQMVIAKEEARHLVEEMKAQKEKDFNIINALKKQYEGHDLQIKTLQQDLDKGVHELKAAKAQAEGLGKRAAFLEEEKQAMQREWERERVQFRKAAEDEKLALQRDWERERGQVLQSVEKEKQSMQVAWENERAKLQQMAEESKLDLSQERQTLEKQFQEQVQANSAHLSLVQQNIAVAEAQKIAHWRALRAAEGKYIQLKEQFEEKSDNLTVTRRQLFEAQERAEMLQRQLDEIAVYGRFVDEKPLIKHILRMERECDRALVLSKKEIESLEDLISSLLK